MKVPARLIVLLLTICWSGLFPHGGYGSDQESYSAASAAARRILVRFKPGVRMAASRLSAQIPGAHLAASYGLVENLHLLEFASEADVRSALLRLQSDPDVLYVEPDHVRRMVECTPNDPDWRDGKLWGLEKIHLADAWCISTGDQAMIVADVDTGLDYRHPDFNRDDLLPPGPPNLWINRAEDPDGWPPTPDDIDNDGNGYVDDILGINAVTHTGDPMDYNGHGTHTAGTIGAVGDNSRGVVGVNWKVQIMALSFLDESGYGTDADAIKCLDYVAGRHDLGEQIVAVNASWGGYDYGQALYDAIRNLGQRGILFIAAAGNDGWDNDVYPSFPANYALSNLLSIAASNQSDGKANFSQYGLHSVQVAAPGKGIKSTVPDGRYDTFDGTSMAAPHVTGAVALLRTLPSAWSWAEIRNRLVAGGEAVPWDTTPTISGKRLSVTGAMDCVDQALRRRVLPRTNDVYAAPGEVLDLSVLSINCAVPDPAGLYVTAPDGYVILLDDGSGPDQTPNDGLFTGRWRVPLATGSYQLIFPNSDVVTVHTLRSYTPSVVPYEWENITGTGVFPEPSPINPTTKDWSMKLVNAPFPIWFGGRTFDGFKIAPNGILSTHLGAEGENSPPVRLPVPEGDTVIAPFTEDLKFAKGSTYNVFYQTVGSVPHRKFVVEWRDAFAKACGSSGGTVRFQAVFFEDSPNIRVNYRDVTFETWCPGQTGGEGACVGIQTGQSALVLSYLAPSLRNEMSVLWTLGCPQISISPPQLPDGVVDQSYVQTFTASGGQAPYGFSLSDGSLPTGLVLDGSGSLSGVPSAPGRYDFVVSVTDDFACTASWQYTIDIASQPCPTIVVSPPDLPSATVGEEYHATISASGGVPPYTYSVALGQIPDGLSLDPLAGKLSGIPTMSATYAFVIEVTDGAGCTAEHAYVIKVDSPPCPFFGLAPPSIPPGVVGELYTAQFTALGGTPPYRFELVGSLLPPSFFLKPESGVLSGTPDAVGAFLFQIRATDAVGCAVIVPYVLDVKAAPCSTILIDPTELPKGSPGQPYSATLAASGGQAPYVYSTTAGTFPPSLVLDATSGVIAGTYPESGTYVFAITATDSNGCTGSQAYLITIPPEVCPAISLGPESLPDGAPGVPYDAKLTASGGVEPYRFEIVGGSLPEGLRLDLDGLLRGVPTEDEVAVVAVRATDSRGCTGLTAYLIKIGVAGRELPDLTGSFEGRPKLVSRARGVRARLKVENIGAAQAGSFNVRLLASRDAIPSADDLTIYEKRIEGLPSDQATTLRVKYSGPRPLKKNRTLILIIDTDAEVTEVDETNNTATFRLR